MFNFYCNGYHFLSVGRLAIVSVTRDQYPGTNIHLYGKKDGAQRLGLNDSLQEQTFQQFRCWFYIKHMTMYFYFITLHRLLRLTLKAERNVLILYCQYHYCQRAGDTRNPGIGGYGFGLTGFWEGRNISILQPMPLLCRQDTVFPKCSRPIQESINVYQAKENSRLFSLSILLVLYTYYSRKCANICHGVSDKFCH